MRAILGEAKKCEHQVREAWKTMMRRRRRRRRRRGGGGAIENIFVAG
jgi:hypothetical protein